MKADIPNVFYSWLLGLSTINRLSLQTWNYKIHSYYDLPLKHESSMKAWRPYLFASISWQFWSLCSGGAHYPWIPVTRCHCTFVIYKQIVNLNMTRKKWNVLFVKAELMFFNNSICKHRNKNKYNVICKYIKFDFQFNIILKIYSYILTIYLTVVKNRILYSHVRYQYCTLENKTLL